MKTTIYTFLAASILAISSCQSEDGTENTNAVSVKPRQDIPLSRTEELISSKTQEFSLNLIKEVLQSEDVKGKNLFFSPLGVSAVLNMMANGANGNTATEIYSSLSPEGCTAEDLNGFYSKLNTWLPDLDNTTTVAEAYSLWVNNQFSVKSSYTNLLKSTLNSDVFVKDFSNPQSTQDLYDWCSEKTNGCIKDIDLHFASDKLMVAANALYFKGTWKNKFSESQTRGDAFHGTTNTSYANMMYKQNLSLWYATSNDFTSVALPYGNEAYSMLLVLPPKNCDMAQAGKQLMEDVWADLTTQAKTKMVDLKLPRFEMTNEFSLKAILQTMGVKDAFDTEEANFGNLSDDFLYLKDLAQKAFIHVDESGAEAASVTYIGGDTAIGNPTITFNRPFFFFIREQSTGLILFMGKVEDL